MVQGSIMLTKLISPVVVFGNDIKISPSGDHDKDDFSLSYISVLLASTRPALVICFLIDSSRAHAPAPRTFPTTGLLDSELLLTRSFIFLLPEIAQ
jgi:hypothetical protein